MTHENGPGLKILSDRKWYGPGYCGICGTTDENPKYSPLIPQAVRWWDCDDGWKMGVLCLGCGREVKDRGPRPDDYASLVKDEEMQKIRIDVTAELGDEDAAYTESQND